MGSISFDGGISKKIVGCPCVRQHFSIFLLRQRKRYYKRNPLKAFTTSTFSKAGIE